MKKCLLIVISTFIFISSPTVHSQSESNNFQKTIGIGLSLVNYTELFTSIMGEGFIAPTIFIPVKVSSKLALNQKLDTFDFLLNVLMKIQNLNLKEEYFK